MREGDEAHLAEATVDLVRDRRRSAEVSGELGAMTLRARGT